MEELATTGLSIWARSRGNMLIEAFDLERTQPGSDLHAGLLEGLFVQAALSLRTRHPSFHSLQDMQIEGIEGSRRALFRYEYKECSSLRKIITQWSNSPARGLPLAHVRRIIYQLVQAISNLHSKGLIHCGLCPDSMIMHESGILKVGGLCYSSLVPKVSKGIPLRLPPPLHYMSPELILKDIRGLSADIWSIGCICGELATGQPLFPGKSEANQLRLIAVDVGVSSRQLTIFREREDAGKILYGISNHDFDSHFRDRHRDLERPLLDFLSLCLQPDASKRATAEELLRSPFLREAAAECNSALADEEERMRTMWTEARARSLSSSFIPFAMTLKGLGANLMNAAESIAMPLPPELASSPPHHHAPPDRSHSPPPLSDERISPNRVSPNSQQARGGLSATGAALFGGPPPAVPWLKKQPPHSHAASPTMAPNAQVFAPMNSRPLAAPAERTSGPRLAPLTLNQPRTSGEASPSPTGLRYDASGRVFNEFGDELDPNELPGRISDTHRAKIESWLHGTAGGSSTSTPGVGRKGSQNLSSPGTFTDSPAHLRSQSNNLMQADQFSGDRTSPPGLRVPSMGAAFVSSYSQAARTPSGLLIFEGGLDKRTSNNGEHTSILSNIAQRTSNTGEASSGSFVLPPRHSFLPASSGTYGLQDDRLSGGGRPQPPDLRLGSASRMPALHPEVYNIAPALANLSITSRAGSATYNTPLSISPNASLPQRLSMTSAGPISPHGNTENSYQDDGE